MAALLHRAIGSRLTCVFVDNGLLRKGDGESGSWLAGLTSTGIDKKSLPFLSPMRALSKAP
ncbi:MAG: hypothetical protein AB7O86_13235 [Porticoccaceae bacterium]